VAFKGILGRVGTTGILRSIAEKQHIGEENMLLKLAHFVTAPATALLPDIFWGR